MLGDKCTRKWLSKNRKRKESVIRKNINLKSLFKCTLNREKLGSAMKENINLV